MRRVKGLPPLSPVARVSELMDTLRSQRGSFINQEQDAAIEMLDAD